MAAASEAQLKQLLADVFNIDTNSIGDDTSVDTVEKWDSLNHLNLVIALEGMFNISFTEEQTIEMLNYPLIKMTLREHGVKL